MSKIFKIDGNALVIEDSITFEVELDEPIKDVYFDTRAMNRGKILITQKFGSKSGDTAIGSEIDISSAVDESGVQFTIATFRAFARLNLGKSSPDTGAFLIYQAAIRMKNQINFVNKINHSWL